jgi:hypothetical protein
LELSEVELNELVRVRIGCDVAVAIERIER